EQRVAIAVRVNFRDLECMTRALAFLPQATLAAAEEHHPTSGEGGLERLAIHIADHQHGGGSRVLDDRGHETVAFREVEPIESGNPDGSALSPDRRVLWVSHRASGSASLTGIPASRSSRLSSGIPISPE